MDWDDDAQAALAKAPFFVRRMISRRVEEHAREQRREKVTLADIEQVRAKHFADNQRDCDTISAEQIEQKVRNSGSRAFADERTYEVKVCSSPDCPRSLFDVRSLAEKMVRVIEGSGVPDAVVARAKGPILRHHKLVVSISGCPNSCSQPQIADFGVQGRARPVGGPGDCTDCSSCVRVCREDAVASGKPVFARDRCIDCGDCIAVCPTRAIVVAEQGFSVLVGGKLGRKPQLAQPLCDFADEHMLHAALHVVCDVFVNDLREHERVADAIRRIGNGEIADRCAARFSAITT